MVQSQVMDERGGWFCSLQGDGENSVILGEDDYKERYQNGLPMLYIG